MEFRGCSPKYSKSCMEAAVMVAIISGGLNMGLNLGLLGPTLPDLALYTGISLTATATIVTWRSFAFIIASLVSGLLLDSFEGYLCIAIVLLFQGVTTAISPWFRNYITLSVLQAFASFFSTIVISGTTFLCFQLEASKARILSQTAILLFNVGKTAVPFIVVPFLASNPNQTRFSTTPGSVSPRGNYSTVELPTLDDEDVDPSQTTHVGWSYVIVGAFCLCMSILYFAIALVNGCEWRAGRRSQEKKNLSEGRDATTALSKTQFIFATTIFLCIVFFQTGIEFMDGNLLMTQVSVYMGRTKLTGLIVTAVYQGIKIFVSLGTILIINRVHPVIILLLDSVFMIIGTLIMTAGICYDSDALFYIGIICLGIGMANYYATLYACLQIYTQITGKIAGLITLSFGISGMVWPPVATWLLSLFGAIAFPLVQLVLAGAATVLLCLFKLAVKEKCCPKLPLPDVATSSVIEKDERSLLTEDPTLCNSSYNTYPDNNN